jgi:hypothetical protein
VKAAIRASFFWPDRGKLPHFILAITVAVAEGLTAL